MRRILVEVDFETMPFETASEVSAALAVLTRLAKEGHIGLADSVVRGNGTLTRKPRADAKKEKRAKLSAQEVAIRDFLRGQSELLTTNQIADAINMNRNSVRPGLNRLKEFELVEVVGTDGQGKRGSNLWRYVPTRGTEQEAGPGNQQEQP